MSFGVQIAKLVLRPTFTAAASGLYSFLHLSSQIPDPVYLLMASAVIGGGTGLVSEIVGDVAHTAVFLGGCRRQARDKGWPVGEVFLEEASSSGPVSKAARLAGWAAWLTAGLIGMNMMQAKLTESFQSHVKPTTSYSEPAPQQSLTVKLPGQAPPTA